jgi:hypothetical protein
VCGRTHAVPVLYIRCSSDAELRSVGLLRKREVWSGVTEAAAGCWQVPVAESKPDPGYSIESPFAAGSALSAPKREFASLALAMRHASMRVSPTSQSGDGSCDDDGRRSMASQWQAAADKATAHAAARRIRCNNKVRSLQRTPLHMVIHRMRQLVEKRESLVSGSPCAHY